MAAERFIGQAVLAAVLLTGAPPADVSTASQDSPPRSQQQPIRSESTFVRVDVYPTRDGRPVPDLRAEDFEILEDGVPQQIKTFEHVVVPIGPGIGGLTDPGSQREMLQAATNPRARVIVVFFDIPHVSLFGSHAIKEPVITLIRRILGPDDLVGLMTPEMSAPQVVLGRKTQVIEELLRRNWDWGQAGDNIPRLTERENMYMVCYPEAQYPGLAAQMIVKSRERATLEAMQDLVTYLGAIREERKAIVAVSNGWRLQGESREMMDLRRGTEPIPGREPITVGPNGQPMLGDRRNMVGVSRSECDGDRLRLSQMDNARFFRDVLDAANRANASFYPVDPRGLVAPFGRGTAGSADRLRELADNTDGIAIVDSNDLDRGVRRVVDDLTSYYLIGYNSTNAKLDGRFRRLQVKVKQSDVQVRARRGYRAAATAEVASPAKPGSRASSPLAEAMSTLSRLRPDATFRINAAHLTDGTQLTIWIAGELQANAGGADEFAAGATADLEIEAGSRSTTAHVVLEPGQRGFVTSVTLPTSTDLTIRARVSGEGSTEPLTDVLRTAIGPAAAQPLIFRRGPSTANRVVPTADLRFTRAERIRLELPVTATARPGVARLLDRRGTPLPLPVSVGERMDESTGQRWITAELLLAPLAAGDYAIEQAPEGMEKVITAIRITR